MTDEFVEIYQLGRPKKTLDDLPEGWKMSMLDRARQGASKLEVRVEILGISNNLWYRFIAEHEEFGETVKVCGDLCQSYWERLGRELSAGVKEGSAATWIFNMKNRFGWRDKSEDGNPADDPPPLAPPKTMEVKPMTLEESRRAYQEALADMMAELPE